MRIEANGNVGIGTSSPAHNLEIVATNSGSINDSLQIRNNSGDTGSGSRIRFITSNDKNSDTNGASLGTVRNGNDNAMFFETENAERMRIDTNGKVGIGTTSPQEQVDISSSAPRIRFSDTSVTGLHHKIGSEANDFEISCDTGNDQADSHIGFKIDGSERMRIDSSGNLLVGKTSDGSAVSTEGINLRPFTTPSTFTRDGGTALQIARLTSDGSLIKFYKDGTLIGEIGTRSDKLHIGNGDTGLEFHGNDDTIYPTNPTTGSLRDNSIDFGSNLYRFKDLYLSGGLYVGGTGTANKLDDYEEGTWTPTANSGLSGFAVTIAKYTKIGNLVTVMTYLTSITGKNASILTIGGLPFNYGTNLFQPAVADLQNKMRWVRTGSNSDTLNFYNEDRTSVVGNDVGTHIILNITYQIS
jgi:hypothetical protein